MCQLGGIVNIQNQDEKSSELIEQITRLMLAKMGEANPHGCGLVLSYQDHQGFLTLKSPNTGGAVAQTLELDKTRPFKHILLHTRFATQGAISETNSHPHFGATGAIVHNGWCPELYASIADNWHHNALELREKLTEMNGKPQFSSDCDSEALALIFNEDPSEFAKNLVGDEVFCIAHMDNSGNKVTLFTQYNTVNMAYSHALGAVIFATRRDVVEEALDFLGESWPIAEVISDQVYYFDGTDMTGGRFDFSEAAMENMEKHYSYYSPKSNKAKAYEFTDVERDDLDTYFKPKDTKEEWSCTKLADGSSVWEHISGEVIHCSAENNKAIEEAFAGKPEVKESLEEFYANMPEETGDDSREFLDKDFKKVQETIQQQIIDELQNKGD